MPSTSRLRPCTAGCCGSALALPGPDGSYYYLDDPGAKVRYLVLNSVWCPYGEDETGRPSIPGRMTTALGQEQLTWVAQVGLRFEEPGWALVVMTHVPVHTGCDGKFRDRELDRDAPCVCNRRDVSGGVPGQKRRHRGRHCPGLYQFGRPVFL